jgi:radical SAM superfamily enzyme YgiQ (UPF0313 family)
MSSTPLVSIQTTGRAPRKGRLDGQIMLVKPPYFTPWTPPLGIAILKSFLAQHGFAATCFDFNVDPELWGMHHKYFATLQKLENVSINDGYSKLWWILSAHMLAYVNGAGRAGCARVLATSIPLFGIKYDRAASDALIPLVERFFDRLAERTDEIDLSHFAAVGTSTYTTSLAASLFVLRRVKEKYPHLLTVMGGGIFADDLALGSDNLNTLIAEYPYVDHMILGEGELLLLKLLEGEFAHKRVISIADLHGKTLAMGDVPTPDFTDLELSPYYQLTIEGARSCPFQCSFCSETIQWGDYRKKPTDVFVDQVVELARRHDNNAFFMGDSLMNPYLNAFASTLIERQAGIVYDGYLRADKPVANRQFVRRWAASGLYRVRLGIESAAARVLDAMDKMTTPQVISDVLKTLAGQGIRTTTYWIVGFPGETEEDFQETCDFIRAHHQFIYELEAHPYYYYPYGQIGSRLYQCHALYPTEVTDVIKFKLWEIDDVTPPRDVRYDRLRRISKLAAELGLPNIYTMAERYAAEERWFQLHPLAAEVYGRTDHRRPAARPSGVIRPVAAERVSEGHETATALVLCYRMKIGKRLDERVLAAALTQLLRYNETLQLSLVDGALCAAPADGPATGDEALSVWRDADGDDAATAISRHLQQLATEMRPERGRSVHALLVPRADDAAELFLLAHRGVADSRSVVLLCEDLFRIYEQLAHEREVSLRPVEKTFGEYVEELTAWHGAVGARTDATAGLAPARRTETTVEPERETNSETHTAPVEKVLALDAALLARLRGRRLREADTEPGEVLVVALLNVLARELLGAELGALDLLLDQRAAEPALAYTTGPLTGISRLAPAAWNAVEHWPAGQRAGLSWLAGIAGNGAAGDKATGAEASGDAACGDVLLNLEYLVAEPWLGGEEWHGAGFVPGAGVGPRGGYALELVPVVSVERVEVRCRYRLTPRVSQIVERVAAALADEVVGLLVCAEAYAAAREFWLAIFSRNAPAANVPLTVEAGANGDTKFVARPFTVESALLAKLGAEAEADEPTVLLAAFALLLSRLSGQQDVVVATSRDDGRGPSTCPLRLSPLWEMSFGEFVRAVVRARAAAAEHARHAFEILTDEALLARETCARPRCDVGFACTTADAATPSIDAPAAFPPAAQQTMKLILVATQNGAGELAAQLVYDQHSFSPETVEQLCAHLQTLLAEAAADPDVQLGEVALIEKPRAHVAPDVLLREDAFNFG